jgi:predicted enzyme related to lactoylglutathione lyase
MPKSNMDIVLDCADPERLSEFWAEAMRYDVLIAFDEMAVLVPKSEVRPPIILMRVPEAKSGKNRMHIDIVTDDIEGEVARMEGLGAKRTHDGERTFGESRWVTMTDPEENEFCVCTGVEW